MGLHIHSDYIVHGTLKYVSLSQIIAWNQTRNVIPWTNDNTIDGHIY